MATRFFLRNLTISATGTYPSAERASMSAAWQMTGALTPKKMSVSAGTAQAQISVTSVGTTSLQWGLVGIWASQPLAAQTVTASIYQVELNCALMESNLNANFGQFGGAGGTSPYLYVWRPSTGAHVADLLGGEGSSLGGPAEPTATNEFQVSQAGPSGRTLAVDVAIQSGDVLILELWIGHSQGMSASYTLHVGFNGSVTTTTDNSVVTNHASFFQYGDYNFAFQGTAITGSSNQTIGSITGTAAATHPVVGSSTQTVGSITATGRGSVAIVGASTQTIGSITATEAGRVYWTGASTQTIGSITGTGRGSVAVVGASTQTIGSITGTANGTVLTHGVSTQTVGSITGTGRGSVAVVGASTQTIGSITATGRGSVLITGASTLTIGSITGTATGSVTSAATILGTSTLTIGSITGTANGTVLTHGSSNQTIGSITATANGTVLTHGSSNQTIGSITATGRGSVAIAGASTQTVGSVTATQLGSVAIAGASTQTVGSITGTATGLIGDIIIGSSSQTIGSITGTAEGAVTGTPTPVPQPDTGAGSGAYAPRRKFRVPEEAYKDWSLELLYPAEQILAPPPPAVDLTNRVVYTPLANAVAAGLPAPRLVVLPPLSPVKVAAPAKINDDDDDDELAFIMSLFF